MKSNSFTDTKVGQSIGKISQKQLIEAAMRDLCEEVKKPDVSDGYIHLRMREILGGSRYSYLLLPLQKLGGVLVEVSTATQEMVDYIAPEKSHERLVKYVYNAWLIVNGLKLSK